MLDFKNIKFRDNVHIPTDIEMNCIQFACKYLLGDVEVTWPKVEYKVDWFMSSKPILINSVIEFLKLNPKIRIKEITFNTKPKNGALVLFRLTGAQIHHAGVYENNEIIHLFPNKGVVKTPVTERILRKGIIGITWELKQ